MRVYRHACWNYNCANEMNNIKALPRHEFSEISKLLFTPYDAARRSIFLNDMDIVHTYALQTSIEISKATPRLLTSLVLATQL